MANPHPKTDHLTPFKPGQSANPGGRPKGLAAHIREIDQAEGKSVLVAKLWEIVHGPIRREKLEAIKILFERGYGRLPEVSLQGELSPGAVDEKLGELPSETLEEILKLVPTDRHSDEEKVKQSA